MIRDAVDLVDSWMRKQKGEMVGQDPLIDIVYIGWRGRDLPWYAAGWEDENLACSPMGAMSAGRDEGGSHDGHLAEAG